MATKSSSNETRRRWLTAYAPLLIWIGVILFLGSGQGSMTRTSLIIRPLLEFLFPDASPETITYYHAIVRKLAHFTEYGMLALLAFRAAVRISLGFVRRHPYLTSLALVICVASTDEYLQSFEPSRTSSPYDVLLDISGGIVMLVVTFIIVSWRSRSKSSI